MHLYINKMQSAMRRVGDPDGFSPDPDQTSKKTRIRPPRKNPDPTCEKTPDPTFEN